MDNVYVYCEKLRTEVSGLRSEILRLAIHWHHRPPLHIGVNQGNRLM